jgi:hypothetical protein
MPLLTMLRRTEQAESETNQTKTFELERRIQRMEESCGEMRRMQETILKSMAAMQRKLASRSNDADDGTAG